MVSNKQGYKKVCEDIDQQLRVYETQQKLSDSSICVEPYDQVETAENPLPLNSIGECRPSFPSQFFYRPNC